MYGLSADVRKAVSSVPLFKAFLYYFLETIPPFFNWLLSRLLQVGSTVPESFTTNWFWIEVRQDVFSDYINITMTTINKYLQNHLKWKFARWRFRHQHLNPRTYMQTYTPTVVQGAVLQYFENILHLQEKVNIMGCSAGGSPWRHPKWPTIWPPSWILLKI